MPQFDMYAIFKEMFQPLVNLIYGFFILIFSVVGGALLLFFLIFFVTFVVNPFTVTPWYLAHLQIEFKPYDLLRWWMYDLKMLDFRKKTFNQYGFTIFVGRQGGGKTTSMVEYLRRMKERFPSAIIVTNFKCTIADKQMDSWRDFMEIRNGTDGVIFAIDEIHSEYSSESWKDFPEALLSEICQQRKQRIKIIATAQVFSRCAKQIREQAFSVVMCKTYFGRLTVTREYDATEYSTSESPYIVKKRCKPIGKYWFVQSNDLRECFDTYEKIERLKGREFIKRNER